VSNLEVKTSFFFLGRGKAEKGSGKGGKRTTQRKRQESDKQKKGTSERETKNPKIQKYLKRPNGDFNSWESLRKNIKKKKKKKGWTFVREGQIPPKKRRSNQDGRKKGIL